jgi:nicotinamidase-related amidase
LRDNSATGGVRAMLIESAKSCLILVDLQARLAPAISGRDEVVRNARLLLRAAARLDVPAILTEQYPRGLGATLPEIAALAPGAARVEKVAFCSLDEPAFASRFQALGRRQVVLGGTEAHVCVLQTGMALLADGASVFVVADAVGSRDPRNAAAALRRLERAGAEAVTTEMVVFEWLKRAGTDAFRDLLPAIKGGD